MKKIVIIGPESTGKTTLTKQLAAHYDCPMVEEYARAYIDRLNRPYCEQDLLEIARGQVKSEDRFREVEAPYLFCDTDLRVIKIWSSLKYQQVHPWILDQIARRQYDAYLLTDIDLPWQPDPQREHPLDRLRLFEIYRAELASSGVLFTIISGTGSQRLEKAVNSVSAWSNVS